MPESLVYSLDKLSKERGESRSAILREAAARYVADADEAEAVRQYIISYEETPETDDERAWGEAGAIFAAEVWGEEDWSAEYEQFLKESDEAR